ncbi:MAG: efflux RND transporter periplasmic adaptor subunit [Verrucomicrobiaceae bacterium]|nr:MAG: efflux RND transporter periplasmic adaptor subunit [Verrucomicrobiaceae bacterium]
MKTFLLISALLGAAAAGWVMRSVSQPAATSGISSPGERQIVYYQSAMHPWIKSDKPGKCTICGMDLTPVYEGQTGMESTNGPATITLAPSQVHVLNVRTAQAAVQPLVKSLRVAGTMDDDERRHRILSAWTAGRIEKLYANHHGVEVAAGEPLARIYSPALLQAERDYRQLTGPLKQNTALRLKQMGLTEEQIAALPSKPENELSTEILAPMTGTVVEHHVYEGQYVPEGANLFEIADFSIMWFLFQAYEQDFAWIKPGQQVRVTVPSVPGKTFSGKVVFIDPNLNPMTRTTDVRVEIANPEVDGRRELLHKVYADGIVSATAPEVLAVPRSTVLSTGQGSLVYVDHGDGTYEQRAVETGRVGDTLVEIVSGLKAGEKVVSNGNLLIDGQTELNRPLLPEPAAHGAPALTFTPARTEAVRTLVATADAMADALAKSDLPAFNQASGPVMDQCAAVAKAFAGEPSLTKPLAALTAASHLHGFEDLKSARTAFHTFAVAATDLLQPVRGVPGVPDFKVWECFMVDQIVPDVPAKGRWLQLSGRAGQNPYFGKSMLDCVREIQPGAPNP